MCSAHAHQDLCISRGRCAPVAAGGAFSLHPLIPLILQISGPSFVAGLLCLLAMLVLAPHSVCLQHAATLHAHALCCLPWISGVPLVPVRGPVLQRGAAVEVVCYVFGGMSAELPGER